ncbi:DUF6233 domain-containing protein [Streptomyces sp. NPDC016309]|uniref:DUF6233 domain-containing protein n=1 Tax=Streptomyces sp. NPDC016309 TaxID=3364965 RepID=UPI0037020116
MWLEPCLADVRQAIAGAGRREWERQHGREARPLGEGWLLEAGTGAGPAVYVHVGGCHMAGKRCRGVPRDIRLRALAAPDLRADARTSGYGEPGAITSARSRVCSSGMSVTRLPGCGEASWGKASSRTARTVRPMAPRSPGPGRATHPVTPAADAGTSPGRARGPRRLCPEVPRCGVL